MRASLPGRGVVCSPPSATVGDLAPFFRTTSLFAEVMKACQGIDISSETTTQASGRLTATSARKSAARSAYMARKQWDCPTSRPPLAYSQLARGKRRSALMSDLRALSSAQGQPCHPRTTPFLSGARGSQSSRAFLGLCCAQCSPWLPDSLFR